MFESWNIVLILNCMIILMNIEKKEMNIQVIMN